MLNTITLIVLMQRDLMSNVTSTTTTTTTIKIKSFTSCHFTNVCHAYLNQMQIIQIYCRSFHSFTDVGVKCSPILVSLCVFLFSLDN